MLNVRQLQKTPKAGRIRICQFQVGIRIYNPGDKAGKTVDGAKVYKLINGVDISTVPKKALYRLFSVVFQEATVFPYPMGSNLSMKVPEEIP